MRKVRVLISLSTLPASQVVGNSLTIQTGLLAVSKNTGYASQSVGPNTSAVKIGSYLLQNQSTSEAVRVTSLLVGLTQANGSTALTALLLNSGPGATYYPALTNFSSLYVAINGTNTTPIQPAGSNTFSINNLTIAPGATQEVDVYANTSADAMMVLNSPLTWLLLRLVRAVMYLLAKMATLQLLSVKF